MMRHLDVWLSGSMPRRFSRRWTSPACWLAAVLTLALWSAGHAAEQPPAGTATSPESTERSPSDAPPTASDTPLSQEKQAPQPQAGVCQTFRVREQDQIWLVSTRHLGCAIGGKHEPAFQVWRYENGWWQPRTEADFFAEDSADLVTPMYVHGNQIDWGLSASYGLSVYFQLVGKLDHEPPARFVIWSWPSDEIKGPLRDVRAKAARSDVDAYYLGCFLSRMQPDVRVGLIGYSFGARIVSGAMHLLGGGSLFGQILSTPSRPQVRVAMWAAAEHNHWYLPNQFHSQALAAADAWFITINTCDPILARYRLLDKCGDPSAVGFAGIYGRNLLPSDVNARIEEVNVSNIVGSEHHWRPYLYSLYIQNRTREYVLWHELGLEPAQPAAVLTAAK
jgi:hypothetical protein